MSSKRTTTVFDTEDAFVDLLEAQPWPAHPTTAQVPLIVDGDTRDPFDEAIVFAGAAPGRGGSEWKTLGSPSQDERFTLQVRIGTKVDGATQREVRARLRDLVAVLESALRDQTTGRPTGGFIEAVGGVQYMTWQVIVVATEVYALAPPQGGFGGYADIEVPFVARI